MRTSANRLCVLAAGLQGHATRLRHADDGERRTIAEEVANALDGMAEWLRDEAAAETAHLKERDRTEQPNGA